MPASLWNKESGAVGFSSENTEWETPQDFYDELHKVYKFTLDPCASYTTPKCENFYTEAENGLEQSWEGHTVFMNPPYGREIKKWIQKAYEESCKTNTKVVCLIPARTDTKYWHEYCMRADRIYFVKGRLKFSGAKNACPFPSAVVVFGEERQPKIGAMTSGGKER